LDKSILA